MAGCVQPDQVDATVYRTTYRKQFNPARKLPLFSEILETVCPTGVKVFDKSFLPVRSIFILCMVCPNSKNIQEEFTDSSGAQG